MTCCCYRDCWVTYRTAELQDRMVVRSFCGQHPRAGKLITNLSIVVGPIFWLGYVVAAILSSKGPPKIHELMRNFSAVFLRGAILVYAIYLLLGIVLFAAPIRNMGRIRREATQNETGAPAVEGELVQV